MQEKKTKRPPCKKCMEQRAKYIRKAKNLAHHFKRDKK